MSLVESPKTTLSLSIKSFGQVIIFEIGTHYENADIILTIKTLIIHSAHTIIYFCNYIWNFHIMLRLVIYFIRVTHLYFVSVNFMWHWITVKTYVRTS